MTREEALKIVRENYPHFGTTEPWLDLEKALATLIPELRESEDERIKKNCIHFLELQKQHHAATFEIEECIAWLEKQKEQKPAEWSEEDEKRIKQLIYDTEAIRAGYEKKKEQLGDRFNDALIKDCDEQIRWLKSLRPQPHWKPSEEQMAALSEAVSTFDGYEESDAIKSLYNQLKKLV